MHIIQQYLINRLYASIRQDYQFHFSLANVLRYGGVALGEVVVYDYHVKQLPDKKNTYKVYTIGDLDPRFIQLLISNRTWYRDVWINMEEDANTRNYFFQVHDQLGLTCPAKNVYYSFVRENALLIAVQVDTTITRHYPEVDFKYLRVYSNYYLRQDGYTGPTIEMKTILIPPGGSITEVTNYLTSKTNEPGEVLTYINGYLVRDIPIKLTYKDTVTLIYDPSIQRIETYPYSHLKPFTSALDDRVKLALYRDTDNYSLQYKDDLDFYLMDKATDGQGVLFYQHKDFAVRNITNNDYALDSYYVGNQIILLNEQTKNYTEEKQLLVIVRDGNTQRELTHTALRLKDLYQLSKENIKRLLNIDEYSEHGYRVEHFEQNAYFSLMGAK